MYCCFLFDTTQAGPPRTASLAAMIFFAAKGVACHSLPSILDVACNKSDPLRPFCVVSAARPNKSMLCKKSFNLATVHFATVSVCDIAGATGC